MDCHVKVSVVCYDEDGKIDSAKDFICGMKESEESKVKPKLWMVEEGVSER